MEEQLQSKKCITTKWEFEGIPKRYSRTPSCARLGNDKLTEKGYCHYPIDKNKPSIFIAYTYYGARNRTKLHLSTICKSSIKYNTTVQIYKGLF